MSPRLLGSLAAVIVPGVVLTGCSTDDPRATDDAAGKATTVLDGCEDVADQDVAVELEPAPGTDATLDALLGVNFNAAGAPCLDVTVWDMSPGWRLDHYTISANAEDDTEITSNDADFGPALRLIAAMDCAEVEAEVVYTKKSEQATFTASTRVCPQP